MSTTPNTSLIAVIRHGDYHQKPGAPSALQPYPLTNEGTVEVRVQAQQFAKVLKENNWKLHHQVHSSPLLRAWQTAQIFIEELADFFEDTPQHLEFPALCERAVGSVANLTVSEIEQVLKDDPRYESPPQNWKSDSHYCLPFLGAESLNQAGERLADHLVEFAHQHEANCVRLFVGHGAAIRHAACHLGVMKLCDVSRLSMYHAHPLVFSHDQQGWQHLTGNWKVRKSNEDVKD